MTFEEEIDRILDCFPSERVRLRPQAGVVEPEGIEERLSLLQNRLACAQNAIRVLAEELGRRTA